MSRLITISAVVGGAGLALTGAVLLAPAVPVDALAQRPAFPIRAAPAPTSLALPAELYAQGMRADQVAVLRRTLAAAPSHGLLRLALNHGSVVEVSAATPLVTVIVPPVNVCV